MFEYRAVENSDASSFSNAVNKFAKDGWEIESSGMVARGQYGYTIWFALMKRATQLGD